MKAESLIAFLKGDSSARELQSGIDEEVRAWSAKLNERGRSAPIILDGCYERFDVTPARAVRLLDAFLGGELSQEAFAYTLDALLLDERFRWSSLDARDCLESILDPEARRNLDRRRAWKVRAELMSLRRA